MLARIQSSIDQSAATNYGRTAGTQRQEPRDAVENGEPLEAAELSQRLEPSDNFSQQTRSEAREESEKSKS